MLLASVALGGGCSGDTISSGTPDPDASPVAPPSELARERCAVRVGIALTGTAPDAELRAAEQPSDLAQLARLMQTDAFRDRFAGFVAAELNDGVSDASDVTYAIVRHVVASGLPWTEVFRGPFLVDEELAVHEDAQGLGYFREPLWLTHYAGSEPEGYMLRMAYRMLNNVLGVTRSIQVADAGAGMAGANVRESDPACRGCHFDEQYGLDRVANLLPQRTSAPAVAPATFSVEVPSAEGEVLFKSATADGLYPDGVLLRGDADLLDTMVESPQFTFHACRVVTTFLYGRAESTAEAAPFDACLDALTASGLITDAVAAIASHPTFCEQD
ncbi:MAG: hypothetical protein R2939_05630 [Kofleriaceae bacterium]